MVSLGQVVFFSVFIAFPLSKTLVKTLAKNLIKNFAKILNKTLANISSDKLSEKQFQNIPNNSLKLLPKTAKLQVNQSDKRSRRLCVRERELDVTEFHDVLKTHLRHG